MNQPSLSSRRPRSIWLLRVLCGLIVIVALLLLAGWLTLRASLPPLDGTRVAPLLSSPLTIERDALGVPTLRGSNRLDMAYATGYVHAQDRFFQMDLLRRVAAGEMSALIGPAALQLDRRNRPNRFRERAHQLIEGMPAGRRYAMGPAKSSAARMRTLCAGSHTIRRPSI